ncbi:MAG: hypothetical protein E8D43_14390 [Nitrospira sp.]|nr:MAG: hypothetical protein E8D43_14390 [Nitrospira sp.]
MSSPPPLPGVGHHCRIITCFLALLSALIPPVTSAQILQKPEPVRSAPIPGPIPKPIPPSPIPAPAPKPIPPAFPR